MNETPATISLKQWEDQYPALSREGAGQPSYGGRLQRHFAAGDTRLEQLRFDNSAAGLRLWNFLLTETERLFAAKKSGRTIVGTMKDLGTVPIMAYALPNTIAFYPDGAWWIPCIMRQSTRDLAIADSLGIDETFCPVRAMLGAFETHQHFPEPDLLVCSVGATCDDFSAIAQRLQSAGHRICWWEIPARRAPEAGEATVTLPGGIQIAQHQIDFVEAELRRVGDALSAASGYEVDEVLLEDAIAQGNIVREKLAQLRRLVFTAKVAPLPALELLIAEMLAIHYCSDRGETLAVLNELLSEVERRVAAGQGHLCTDAAKVYWVNPVADLQAMNLLEECGGRLCGTDFMFCHALDPIPTNVPPFEALARMAIADPMVGPVRDRAARIVREAKELGAQAVIISRIPGASHCALEGTVIREIASRELSVPVIEIEVPSVSDSVRASLRTRMEAVVETVQRRSGGRGMISAGIDGGSRALKVVLFDHASGKMLTSAVRDQVVEHNKLAEMTFSELLRETGIERAAVKRVIATGYARNLIKAANATVTEITCHAVGVRHLNPDAMTVIEIGGQDSKLSGWIIRRAAAFGISR